LRTPLAELRSLAELAVKWPDARAADTDRDVLAIATQMERIVTRLLAMVRSEHGQLCVAREAVDLRRSSRTSGSRWWRAPPGATFMCRGACQHTP
jgi:two-component system sensor histidine kinase QseC